MTTQAAPHNDFAARMKHARAEAGVSLENATFGVRSHLPESEWVSLETIRRMENGHTPEAKADSVLVAALAKVYGVPVASLSQLVHDSANRLSLLLGEVSSTTPEQQNSLTGRYLAATG